MKDYVNELESLLCCIDRLQSTIGGISSSKSFNENLTLLSRCDSNILTIRNIVTDLLEKI